MLLNDLDTTLRNAGLAVTEAGGWQGHNHGALTAVQAIIIHHTATPASAAGDYPSLNIVRNGRSDLPGPLAQLGCGRSGRMYVISNGVAWHAGATRATYQNNYHSIGIEVESPGNGAPWPLPQVHAVAKAAAALCRRYGVPSSRVLGHKEICSPPGRKIDPVGIPGDMRGFRSLVQYYITHPKGEPEVELNDTFNRAHWNERSGTVGWMIEGIRQLATGADRAADAALAAANRAVTGIEDVQGQVAALSLKVDGLSNIGSGAPVTVDIDALAALLVPQLTKSVADELDKRNRDGNPATGQVS